MKIIVGLGNPGKELEGTRHNVGFMVVERIKSQFSNKSQPPAGGPKFKLQKKFKAEILKLVQNNEEVLLVKPQTFMNASGVAVKKIVHYYDKTITTIKTLKHYKNLYIIHDDLDLELGDYKIQFAKGPKRHNGVLSVEKELGTKDFWRVRVGTAKRPEEKKECLLSGKDYVLGKFSKKEKEVLDQVMEEIVKKLLNSYL